MKHIVSYNIHLPTSTLRKTLEFYQLCQTIKSKIYLVANGRICEVNHLPKFISFILTLSCRIILVVAGGNETTSDREKMNHFFKQQEKTWSFLV